MKEKNRKKKMSHTSKVEPITMSFGIKADTKRGIITF